MDKGIFTGFEQRRGGYQLSHIYDSLITIPTSGDQSS